MTQASEGAPVRVVIADDHPIVRAGFRRIVDRMKDLTLVAEAKSGEEAVALCRDGKPDLVIMDLSMPGIGGLEAVLRIRGENPDVRIIVISVHDEISYVKRVLAAGVRGYVTKRAGAEVLEEAIRQVLRGEFYLEHSLATELATRIDDRPASGEGALTEREFAVLLLLVEGASVKEIAEKLYLSPKTVGTYQTRIFRKIGVHNLAALTRWALQKGLVTS